MNQSQIKKPVDDDAFMQERGRAIPQILDSLNAMPIDIATSALVVILCHLICITSDSEGEALEVVSVLDTDLHAGIALHFAPTVRQ